MANTKISALPAASALDGTEPFPAVQAGATVKATATQIIAFVGPGTAAVTGKTTPIDPDSLPMSDSAASNVLKKVTWANIKATLKTYFDTLYQAVITVADTRILFADGANTPAGNGNLIFNKTTVRWTVGSSNGADSGWIMGHGWANGLAAMWNTGVTPDTSNWVLASLGATSYVNGTTSVILNINGTPGLTMTSAGTALAKYLDFTEMTPPSAPAANGGRVFFDDSGGKTRMMVQFATGAAQQVAIEP